MIVLKPQDLNLIASALSAAHNMNQRLYHHLKSTHAALSKDLRLLVREVPPLVEQAHNRCKELYLASIGRTGGPDEEPLIKINDIDVTIFRNELENISALNSPDLDHLMMGAVMELPGLANVVATTELKHVAAARIGSIAWEAGRRYGVLQALAIITGITEEFKEGTLTVLQQALDSSLEFPSTPKTNDGAEIIPYTYKSEEELEAETGPDRSSGVIN